MKKISIFLILFFSKLQAVEHSNNFVLECFALDDLKHDIRYYSVINYNLYYINENKIVTRIPYSNLKVKGKKMFALRPDYKYALDLSLEGHILTLKRVSKEGETINYGCRALNDRTLQEFIN
tara:strand:- start:25 stop:390 length:366 start_codon:yes stop_codon:yes gene_type:complete